VRLPPRCTLFPYTTLFRSAPFVGREDARNDVEGDEPLLRRLLAVDGEGDAYAAEQKLRLLAPLIEQVRRRIVEPLFQRLIAGSRSEEHTSELQSRENLVCR